MGRLQIFREFASPPERATRVVRVYTPAVYRREHDRRFPVLYMHDGQNLFAHPESAIPETWEADKTLDGLARRHAIEPWIIVAVDHREVLRFADYSPWDEPRAKTRAAAPAYARFLIDHLMPWVAQHYRVRTGPGSTAVSGSSLGGLVSLWLGMTRPEIFGRIGALSPSVMWSHGRLFKAWDRKREGLRIYLDAGAKEWLGGPGMPMDYGGSVGQFHRHLQSLGYGEDELRLVLEPGGEHSELDWRRRLPDALEWLLDPTWSP